jgi:hypothetical protein
VSEEKTETRHIKMAQIDDQTKTMKKIDDTEIEKYALKSKENASKRGSG